MTKRDRTALSSAVLAGLGLLAALAGARTGNATSPSQTDEKPCGTVTVAAASDLTYAMNEIAANFQKATGCPVRLTFGSSGNFLSQIENGAPFDVFFSADISYPKKLEAEGLAAPGSTYLYGIGKIVLWTRKDSRVDVGKGLSALRDSTVQKIAIANPEHAPYGRAAVEALRKAGLYDAVKNRLVLGENISQAAEFVESGNADASILALSLALSPPLYAEGQFNSIPGDLYTPIEQGAVVPLAAPNPLAARRFLDYIKLPATAGLLERYGFALPATISDRGKR
jgi:molybdate transport system substrate-binding protein